MSPFCMKCKQKITAGIGAMFAQSKPVEFEDGFYCENCAKLKVEAARRQ